MATQTPIHLCLLALMNHFLSHFFCSQQSIFIYLSVLLKMLNIPELGWHICFIPIALSLLYDNNGGERIQVYSAIAIEVFEVSPDKTFGKSLKC